MTLEWCEYCALLPLLVLLVLPCNLLLLPLATAVPALGPWVHARPRRAERLIPGDLPRRWPVEWEWLYLIETPVFKFLVTATTTLAFAATLTFWDPRGTGVVRGARRMLRQPVKTTMLRVGRSRGLWGARRRRKLRRRPHAWAWAWAWAWSRSRAARRLLGPSAARVVRRRPRHRDRRVRRSRRWLVDVLNGVELVALVSCFAALLLWILDYWYVAAAARFGLRAAVRVSGFRLLSLAVAQAAHADALQMINDVLLWLCLLGVVAVSAASAFIVLAEILDCDLSASGGLELSFGSELQRLFYVALEYDLRRWLRRELLEGTCSPA